MNLIKCLDDARATASSDGRPLPGLPCRSCLPNDIRAVPALQSYFAAWSTTTMTSTTTTPTTPTTDSNLRVIDLVQDNVSTEDKSD